MLKKNAVVETVRSVAESVGIIAPSLPDAQAAAERRRAEIVKAQAALDGAVSALEAGHDSDAIAPELARLEAVVTDARVTLDRAQRAYKAAERRLVQAEIAESGKSRASDMAALKDLLAVRETAAAKIDEAAQSIAAARADILAADEQVGALVARGIGDRSVSLGIGRIDRAIELSLGKAGVQNIGWIGVRTEIPAASDLVRTDNATLVGA